MVDRDPRRTRAVCQCHGSEPARAPKRRRRAFTLMEVMVTLTVISVLVASSATVVVRTVEQVYLDYAGSGMHAIWNAQRLYWVEHRSYAPDIATLQTEGMLAESLDSDRYTISVTSANDDTFSVEAVRTGSTRWLGTLIVTEEGVVTGSVTDGVHVLEPVP